jgi:formylglycine-generating enzyme required for sulfatase activity
VIVVEPDTVVIPPGDALLGDPVRTEHVNVFAIARRPVTNAEYARFRSGHPATDDAAVRGVSWAEAVSYCRWLTTSTGHIYRLPDEREWEKAARGGVLEDVVGLEWTNSWAPVSEGAVGGRVLRAGDDPAKRRFAAGDLSNVGFRVVRSMTGR